MPSATRLSAGASTSASAANNTAGVNNDVIASTFRIMARPHSSVLPFQFTTNPIQRANGGFPALYQPAAPARDSSPHDTRTKNPSLERPLGIPKRQPRPSLRLPEPLPFELKAAPRPRQWPQGGKTRARLHRR